MRRCYLIVLTMWNFLLRSLGVKPDEWYWADEELLRSGKYPRFLVWYALRLPGWEKRSRASW